MYNIKYYSLAQFDDLKAAWTELQRGLDMTYFQSYEWNRMLAGLKWDNNKHFDIVFSVISLGESPVLLAPLFISKDNRYKNYPKGCYLWGDQGWSDYCNLVYIEFDKAAFDYLLESLCDQYEVNRFCFSNLKEETALYNYLASCYAVEQDDKTTCVGLSLPDTAEDYQKMLSKNARQNIRTARNRADKDGLTFTINHDDKQLNLQEFLFHKQRRAEIKDKRESEQNKDNTQSSIIQSIINHLRKQYYRVSRFKYPVYTPYEYDKDSKFLTIKNSQTGELCAGINYGRDDFRKEIVVMAISLNEKYNRYSPGILAIYDFIMTQFETREIRTIDFTRGSENYKFVLGGIVHNNHRITITNNK